MNVTEHYERAMRLYSDADAKKFLNWTGFLPKRTWITPFHSGPHSIRNLEMAFLLAGNPGLILEIGFCLGHSSAMWLEIGASHVTSIDNSMRDQTVEGVRLMREKYKHRFDFISGSTDFLTPPIEAKFDLAFIDGGHGVEDVDRDTKFCLDLGIPFLLFDDWFTHWSEGTQPAVEKYNLVPLAILGSMALCVPAKNLK